MRLAKDVEVNEKPCMATRFVPTEEQCAVIEHNGGHALVSAVAGSGKSATLIQRLVHQLKRGTDATELLGLMFNRGAAKGFRQRLARACAEDSLPCPEIFTFHGFGLRLTEMLVERGAMPDWALETKIPALAAMLRGAMEEANRDLSAEDAFDPWADDAQSYLAIIDQIKGARLPTLAGLCARDRALYQAFERVRARMRVRTFTDLICDPLDAIAQNPDMAEVVGNRYGEILADELQDANRAQVEMLQVLAGSRARVIGVGDDDQVIYVWRGADVRFLGHGFPEVFPDPARYVLSRSFRFGPKIAQIANNVISLNKVRTAKTVVSAGAIDTAVHVRLAADDVGNGQPVRAVQEWVGNGGRLSDVAILGRVNTNA